MICISTLIVQYSFGQKDIDIYKNEDYIVWGSRELCWEDFRGPKLSNDFNAGTYGGLSYYINKYNTVYWFAFFSKDKSWHNAETENGLEHEKYHFNIVEIHARKLRKAIIEKKLSINYVVTLNKKINEIWAECESMQSAYDQETTHSRNSKKQSDWERKINRELETLINYKSNITK